MLDARCMLRRLRMVGVECIVNICVCARIEGSENGLKGAVKCSVPGRKGQSDGEIQLS